MKRYFQVGKLEERALFLINSKVIDEFIAEIIAIFSRRGVLFQDLMKHFLFIE
jgi:hypothetical protein